MMDITREYLLEQREKLLQQAEQQQADLNQTLGAIGWTEHLIAQLDKPTSNDTLGAPDAGGSDEHPISIP